MRTYKAESGQNGMSVDCSGADGQDLVMIVPQGTVIRNAEGAVLYDLADIDEVTVLRGGRGGKGNAFFKNSFHREAEIFRLNWRYNFQIRSSIFSISDSKSN